MDKEMLLQMVREYRQTCNKMNYLREEVLKALGHLDDFNLSDNDGKLLLGELLMLAQDMCK